MSIKTSWNSLTAKLGVPLTLVLIAILFVILAFAATGAWNWATGSLKDRKIRNLETVAANAVAEAQKQKNIAREAETQVAVARAEATLLKQQLELLELEKKELENARTITKTKVVEGKERVRVIRTNPVRAVDSDMSDRVDRLSSKLCELYESC